MVPWSSSQSRITLPTSWFPKLFTKGREISIFDDLTKKGSGALKSQNLVSLLKRSTSRPKKVFISNPLDFRQVSGIIEVDSEPPWRRKILLVRSSSEASENSAPIGFYIREGFNVQVRSDSLDKVPGIFVSRIIPGSLAETSGLITVGDEILDINNEPVEGKSLDEVTMMLSTNRGGVHLTLKPSTGRLFERGPRRNRQSLSAPTPRRNAGLNQPRPQTPLLLTKKAEIRFESHELHEVQDIPPQMLLTLADYKFIDH